MQFVWMPPRCQFLMFARLRFFSFISSGNGPSQGAVAGAAAMIEIATQPELCQQETRAGSGHTLLSCRACCWYVSRIHWEVEELVPAFCAIRSLLCRLGWMTPWIKMSGKNRCGNGRVNSFSCPLQQYFDLCKLFYTKHMHITDSSVCSIDTVKMTCNT